MRVDIPAALTRDPQPPTWVIPDMLPSGTLVALAGDPGVGKSWFAYWLSVHVACGLPLLGQPVPQGTVLYIDQENSLPDLSEYLRQIWHGLDCPPIVQIAQCLIVNNFTLGLDWRTQMLAMAKQYQPSLIVVDTVTPACNIADENDNAEASRVITHLRTVREAAGSQCCLLVLRHARLHFDQAGETPKRSMRGAKAWHGAMDQVLFHIRTTGGRTSRLTLRQTRIEPDKVRAWGLKDTWVLTPEVHDLGVALRLSIG